MFRIFRSESVKITIILFFSYFLGRKFCVESKFQGQGPPRTQEIVKIDVKMFKEIQKISGKNPYLPYIAL